MQRILFWVLLINSLLFAEEKIPVYVDPPTEMYFKDWLLCGPFPNPLPPGVFEYLHDETSLGFYIDYLSAAGGEAKIKPVEGMTIKHPDGTNRVWQKYHGYFGLIPLDDIFSPNIQTIAYAACLVRSTNPRPIALSITSNDGVRIWQNGQLILDHNVGGTEEPDRDLLPIVLQKGDNYFLLKISQGFGKWSFQFRLLNLIKTVWELNERAYLFSRPEVTEKENEWQIFVGQKHKIEMLSSVVPVGLEIRRPDDEALIESFDTFLGKTLTIKKSALKLESGPYALFSKTFKPDGARHVLRSSIFVGDPPSVDESYALFQAIPRIDTTSFYGEQLNNIFHCMDFHLKEDVQRGNSEAMDKWTQRKVVEHYKKFIDHTKINISPYHKVFPAVQSIQLTNGGFFDLSQNVKLVDHSQKKCLADVERFKKTLKLISTSEKQSVGAEIIFRYAKDGIKELEGLFLPHEEAYAIIVKPDKIKVIGASAAGIHNGVITLIQLLKQTTKLPSAKLLDYPANSHRCAFAYWKVPMDESSVTRLMKFIDLKYNEIVVASEKYRELADVQVQQSLTDYYSFLRSFHVEPIPTVWLNGDKSWYEGVWSKDEPVVFKGDAATFGFQRLIDVESSKPTFHAKVNGGEIFERDSDYQIVSVEPPVIRRLPGGKIPSNATIFMDADIVDQRTHRFFKPCASEEAAFEEFEKNIKLTIDILKPKKIHVNHDELGILNSDSRCLMQNKKDDELVAWQINRMRDIIKKYDAKVEMIMWADAVNPYHNAGKKKLENVCDSLYHDIILAHWYYSAENYEQLDLIELGAKFFLEKGFRIYGCPWDHLVNHQAWEQISKVNGDDRNFWGLMHTQWSGRDNGLSQTAAINWSGETWLTK